MKTRGVASLLCKETALGIALFATLSLSQSGFAYSSTGHGAPASAASTAPASKEKLDAEAKKLHDFSADFLKDLGCTNTNKDHKEFKSSAFVALLSYLSSNQKSELKPEAHFRAIIGALRILNHSNIPQSKLDGDKKQFVEVLRKLSDMMDEGLFTQYEQMQKEQSAKDKDSDAPPPLSSWDIANNLRLDNDPPKQRIVSLIKQLQDLAGEDHLNIGCRNAESPKNKLLYETGDGYLSPTEFLAKRQENPKLEIRDAIFRPATNAKPAASVPRRQDNGPATHTARRDSEESEYQHSSITRKKRRRRTDDNEDERDSDSRATSSVNVGDHQGVVRRYLSLGRDALYARGFFEHGWKPEYSEFIGAFVLEGHASLLTHFNKFAEVCDNLGAYKGSVEDRLTFIEGYLHALAQVETESIPLLETRESRRERYRPTIKGHPEVSGVGYIPHSVGLFQLDEKEYFEHGCSEIDYINDVKIGYPNSRERRTKESYEGTYVEYYGDSRKTVLDPFVNAACAVRILEQQLQHNDLFEGDSYWSSMRPGGNHHQKLINLVKRYLPKC